MCTRVRLMFDPLASSIVIEVYNHIIDELEYRMLLMCDDIDGGE